MMDSMINEVPTITNYQHQNMNANMNNNNDDDDDNEHTNQIMDDDHQSKPPPPYEEIQNELNQSASSTTTTSSSSSLPIKKSSTSSTSSVASGQLSFKHQLQHSLSIENPMAEVFSNPEFDHVELKIQGHINPTNIETSSNTNETKNFLKQNKLIKNVRNKLREIFLEWNTNWRRPEIITIRLFIFLLTLLFIIQMVRIVVPINQNDYKATKSLTNNNKHAPAEMMKYSARTGKALSMLSSPTDDNHLDENQPKDSIDVNKKDFDGNKRNFDQNFMDSLSSSHDLNVMKHDSNDENEYSDQNIEHHDDTRVDEHPTEFIDDIKMSDDNISTIHSTTTPSTISSSAMTTTISTKLAEQTSSMHLSSTTGMVTPIPTFTHSSTMPTKLLPRIVNNGNSNNNLNRIPFQTSSSSTIAPLMNNKLFNISIIIHSANVPDMDTGYLMGRASDTYCNVFIDDVLVGKTPIIDNSNNPSWHYLLPRQFQVKRETWIRIELMDSDHLRNDHIGGILLNFGDLLNNGSINKPINMFHGRGYLWVTISSVPI